MLKEGLKMVFFSIGILAGWLFTVVFFWSIILTYDLLNSFMAAFFYLVSSVFVLCICYNDVSRIEA